VITRDVCEFLIPERNTRAYGGLDRQLVWHTAVVGTLLMVAHQQITFGGVRSGVGGNLSQASFYGVLALVEESAADRSLLDAVRHREETASAPTASHAQGKRCGRSGRSVSRRR
jgi:hypothetical protein